MAYRDEAIVAMRAEGASAREIGTAAGLSRVAVRKVLAGQKQQILPWDHNHPHHFRNPSLPGVGKADR